MNWKDALEKWLEREKNKHVSNGAGLALPVPDSLDRQESDEDDTVGGSVEVNFDITKDN